MAILGQSVQSCKLTPLFHRGSNIGQKFTYIIVLNSMRELRLQLEGTCSPSNPLRCTLFLLVFLPVAHIISIVRKAGVVVHVFLKASEF